MTITFDELTQCEERLQAEIAERECLLAAVKVLRGYAEKGKSLKGLALGAVGEALLAPRTPKTLTLEAPEENPPQVAAPAPVPTLPPPKPYRHPELEKLCAGPRHGMGTAIVRWAIDRMTTDFTLHDIGRLLEREGRRMGNAEISVVLTRLQRLQGLEVIRYGRGPNPTLFRTPNPASGPDAGTNDAASSTEEAAVSAAA
jgi:hypothetical protein